MLALRDPSGFTDRVIVLPGPLLDLVSLFDGEHSIAEIIATLERRHGEAPTPAQVVAIADRLDAEGFLDSAAFAARRRAIETAFRRSAVRPAAHAGGAYAGEPAALRAQIDGFFTHVEGPDAVRAASPSRAPRGLLAPHIDFHRGGPTYAWAYREIAKAPEAPDLFVILGTCHAGMADPFSVTLKPYATPLGPAAVDTDLFEALSRRAKLDLLASEAAHRAEHSIEFQAVMLRHLLGDARPFTILPVLASFLHEAVWAGDEAEADPRVPRFLEALGETIAASSRRVCVVAGVDLAHVGPRFGDAAPNTPEFLRQVSAEDGAMLEAVTRGDARGFYESVARDRDRRRICGLSPIYAFLRVLAGADGRLLRYSQWPDPEGAVTFCAVAFP